MGKLLFKIAGFPNLLKARHHLKGRIIQSDTLSFEQRLEDNLLEISESLTKGAYYPSPRPRHYHISVSGKNIPVPVLGDRLVVLAIKQVLLANLESSFIYDTYAGLPLRGTHRAVKRVMDFQRRVALPKEPWSGWILKADIRDFYPSIRHDVLLAQIERCFQDKELLELLSRFFKVWAKWSNTPERGIPLGLSLSALLSNFYLDPFDHFIKDDLGFKFYVRYSDDMAFLSREKEELELILPKARGFLEDKLGMFLNQRKTFIKRTSDGLDFLGYRIFYHHLLLRKKNIIKAKRRFMRLAQDYSFGKMTLVDVKMSLAGWLGYAVFANTYNFRRRLLANFRLKKHSLN